LSWHPHTDDVAVGNLGDGYEELMDLYGNIVQRKLRDDGTVSGFFITRIRYLTGDLRNGRSVWESYFHTKGTDLPKKRSRNS